MRRALLRRGGGGPALVAGCSNGKTVLSNDGVTWTLGPTMTGGATILWLAYGAGVLVAGLATAQGMARSLNGGVTWLYPTPPGGGWGSTTSVAWASDTSTFMALGTVSSLPRFSGSTDGGATWEAPRSGGTFNGSNIITRHPLSGLWITGGSTGVWTSPTTLDGTWTQRSLTNTNQVRFLEWAPGLGGTKGRMVALDTPTTGHPYSSDDGGTTWDNRGFMTSASPSGLAWSPALGMFLAVGSSTVSFTSPDGITWTSRTPAISAQVNQMVWSPASGLFVAVGNGGSIRTSPDGLTWTTRTHPLTGSDSFQAVVALR